MSRDALIERTGVDSAFVTELQRNGLLTSGPAGFFDEDAVRLVEAAAALANYGVDDLRFLTPVYFGDSGNTEMLRRCDIATARALVVTLDNPRAVEAARALGAGPWRAWRTVTLPSLAPAIASAASSGSTYRPPSRTWRPGSCAAGCRPWAPTSP